MEEKHLEETNKGGRVKPAGRGRYKNARVIYADSIVSASTIDERAGGSKNQICQCGCFRRKKSSNVVPDYVVSPPMSTKTVHSIQFIHDTYNRLLSHNYSNTENAWVQAAYCELTDAFKHCRRGLRFLQLLNKFAEESLQSLSYYLEDDLPEKHIQLTDCRSIIGSYTWLIVLCFQSILDPKKILARKDFHHILRDIVNLSVKNWIGIVRTVDFFIKVRIKTESTIDKYIVPMDVENQCKSEDSGGNNAQEKDLLLERAVMGNIRKGKLRQLKCYNQIGHHSIAFENNGASSNFCKFRVLKKPEDQDSHDSKGWTKFESDFLEDQKEEVINLCKYVKEILRDVHINIHFIEKYMNQFQDKNTAADASSYSEANLLFRRALKSLSKQDCEQRNIILNDENRIAMVEMGKILEDNLELTEYFLMSLRALVYESRHAVHVVYEYCRVHLSCEIPRYDIAASVDRRKLLEQFKNRGKEKTDRNKPTTEELPLSREATMREMHGSPYVQMLQIFPLTANGYHYKIFLDSVIVSEASHSSSANRLSPKGVSHVQDGHNK